jgi:hypothetical protein
MMPNPAPLHVDDDIVFDPEVGAWVPRPSALWALLLGMFLGLLFGAVLMFGATRVFAAPRPQQPVIPAVGTSRESGAEGPARGNPAAASGAPSAPASQPAVNLSAPTSAESGVMPGAPQPTAELGTAIESGVIAYADPSHGDRYLALPGGPGAHVRICVGRRCLDRVSTDAGPALFEQARGRIADVSFADFATLCGGCNPASVGVMVATIEWLNPSQTPPPTNTDPVQ